MGGVTRVGCSEGSVRGNYIVGFPLLPRSTRLLEVLNALIVGLKV